MLKEKPNSAMIQEVTVVPMFAPMITPMACPSTSRPAFTKLTTMMVVAVDDWMTAVTPIPVRICLNGLEVMEARKARRPSPATFWRPPERRLRPNRKRVTAPSRDRIWRRMSIRQ